MDAGDVLHMLFLDETGVTVDIDLWSSETTTETVPDAPTALDESDITTISFVANWYFNENSTGYYLDVATDSAFTSMLAGYDNLDVGNVDHYSVLGISMLENYYYRVRAYNVAGTSANSNTITIESPYTVLKYGLLYNWYAIGTNGGTGVGSIAPAGWHVPTLAEWTTLQTFIGGAAAGGKLKEMGTTYWTTPNTGATNELGFYARGTGRRVDTTGAFSAIDVNSWIGTVTEIAGSWEFFRLFYNSVVFDVQGGSKKLGLCCRLIKDDAVDPGSVTDYDGNIYPTVTIGTQVWTALNLSVKHFNDGTPIPEVTDDATWAALATGAWCYYNNDPSNM